MVESRVLSETIEVSGSGGAVLAVQLFSLVFVLHMHIQLWDIVSLVITKVARLHKAEVSPHVLLQLTDNRTGETTVALRTRELHPSVHPSLVVC